MTSLDKYLEEVYILEVLPNELKQFNNSRVKRIAKQAKDSIDEKDPVETIKKISSLPLPKIDIKRIDKFYSKKIDNYFSMKKRADTVLKNSLSDVDEKIRNVCSTIITISSIAVKKGQENINYRKNFNETLKNVVYKTIYLRKMYEDSYDKDKKYPMIPRESLGEFALGMAVLIMSIGITFSLSFGFFTIIKAIIAAFTYDMFYQIIGIIAVCFVLTILLQTYIKVQKG